MSDDKMIPDAAARERALAPDASFIVQAPAGSGKTELLIQRYLGLLATVNEPEEVVAITFTKKAAAEMRERVLEAIAELASGKPPGSSHAERTQQLARAAMARDKALGWRILESPARLRIQTIDALCASLTRQMPMLSKFGSQPESTDDAGALYAEAARATVELIESKEPVAELVERLLVHLDNNVERVEELLVEMLRNRDHWLRHVVGTQRHELERGLVAEREAVLSRLQALLSAPVCTEWLAVVNIAAANLAQPLLAAVPAAGDAEGWAALVPLLLIKSNEWRKSLNKNDGFPAGAAHAEAKQRALALIDSLRGNDALRLTLAAIRVLPPPAYTEAQWAILEAIMGLLRRAVLELKYVFQSRGQVDFTEVSQRALQALGDADGPTDLALRLDYQIRHLLIDEFQDTSISQFELVSRLTAGWMPGDGRTLFVVGDPMQSIYRFREAEVGLFLKARVEGIGSVPLESLQLAANFRSQAGLVDWVNNAFATVMPKTEDIAAGAVPYNASQAVHAALDGAAVSVHPQLKEATKQNIGDAEAATVARIVKDIFAAAPKASDVSGATAIRRPSIAILVRGRNHLREIVPRLQQEGIPFRAIEIDRLDARPVVQDLLALTRALAHEGDRLAWLAVLRAPWCGLTLADLHALAVAEQPQPAPVAAAPVTEEQSLALLMAQATAEAIDDIDDEPFTANPRQSAFSSHQGRTIRELMHDASRLAALSPDGRARLERVRAVLEATLAARLRASLREQVEGAWLALGGPACAADTGLADAETYLDHLEAKEEAGAIADFAAFTQGLDKLFAVPDVGAGEDAVQVMTVHKSKGLEFDHVIVPGLGAKPPTDKKKLFLWMERPRSMGRASDTNLPSPLAGEGPGERVSASYQASFNERVNASLGTDLLLAPVEETGATADPIYAWLKQLAADKASHEDGRLLYVAATRAKQRLHLLGETRLASDQTPAKPAARSLLSKLWDIVEHDYVAAARQAVPLPLDGGEDRREGESEPSTTKPIDQSLHRLTADWITPAPPATLAWIPPAEPARSQDVNQDAIEYSWVGETARCVGNVVHRWLQVIAEAERKGWTPERVGRMRESFSNELAALGVVSAEREVATARVNKALSNALTDERGLWLLGPQTDARNEYRLTAMLNGERRQLVIDRSFTDADGKRWIIDYKTGGHEGADKEGFLDREQARYSAQLERYAEVHGVTDTQLGLYFPALEGWREWENPLQQVAPDIDSE